MTIIEKIINVAAIAAQHSAVEEIDLIPDEWAAPSPEQVALRQCLDEQSDDALCSLLALYYLGRDRDHGPPITPGDLREKCEYLRRIFPERADRRLQLLGKPLARYLPNAVRLAAAGGVNIDQLLSREPVPNPLVRQRG